MQSYLYIPEGVGPDGNCRQGFRAPKRISTGIIYRHATLNAKGPTGGDPVGPFLFIPYVQFVQIFRMTKFRIFLKK